MPFQKRNSSDDARNGATMVRIVEDSEFRRPSGAEEGEMHLSLGATLMVIAVVGLTSLLSSALDRFKRNKSAAVQQARFYHGQMRGDN